MGKAKQKKKRKLFGCLFASVFFIAAIGIGAFYLVSSMFTENELDKLLNGRLSGIANNEIPAEYMPIYQEAADEYEIPWELLAAVHRVETRFSTMDPMISPAGAEGPMQFMPCTWFGWSHPTCEGNGAGAIPNEELTDPDLIAEHGGYGMDVRDKGVADPWNHEDAIFAAARYLSSNGADDGDIEEALFAYNRADWYVEEVISFVDVYNNGYEVIENNEKP
ncbi:lytic transglycosylase domain-containing protein [Geomicrobium sp. JCM 19038]|uniref:lytic transglycosylase domain-containing protein n=1 Tax=Geomicrobium sp. JCM 19038 TaxID=1460635 RepID=UPI00045F3C78|nr:lytic transglycosylase domain-containing protein [Geomicrobium sp. JCM 19038]GAK10029.1 hypothetical protein JCM19038_3907 [Geomicrobium sp. JCM 19038]